MKLTREGYAIIPGDNYLSAQIEREGRLDVQSEFLEQYRRYIPAGGVVVDVGASLGDTAATFAKMVGQSGLVYAFEPVPETYECLLHNMRGYANVVTWERGLGSAGHRTASAEIDTNNIGASRLIPSEGPVSLWTLDGYASGGEFSRLDFLKIDAEGWEPLILDGARETIRRHRPAMLIEVNDWPLGKMGFDRYSIYGRLVRMDYDFADFAGPYGDVLCLPKERQA